MGHREITIPPRGKGGQLGRSVYTHAELPSVKAFIEAFAAKHSLDVNAVKQSYDDTVLIYTGLPSREVIERNKFALNKYGNHDGDTYESLIIELALERYRIKETLVIKQRILSELPATYWRAVLDQTHDPDVWQKRTDTPPWTQKIMPITCKEEYLYAVRHYLHLPAESVADRIHCRTNAIHSVERKESSALSYRANSVGPKLAAYYEKLSTKNLGTPFFDSQCYEALPSGLRSLFQGSRLPL